MSTTIQEKVAVMQAFVAGKKIQVRVKRSASPWAEAVNPIWDWNFYEYRIAPEKQKVPLTPDDIPPVCWVKFTTADGGIRHRMVIDVDDRGVAFAGGLGVTFLGLMQNEYSTDRKTWKSCYKEI